MVGDMSHDPDLRSLLRAARTGAWPAVRLSTALTRLLEGTDETDRAALLRQLYWHAWEVPTATLADLAGGEAALRRAAGRGPVLATCRTCGRAIRARDRDDVDVPASPRCHRCHGRRPAVASRPSRPSRRRAARRCGWELEPVPRPHRVLPADALARGRRVWGEDYQALLVLRPEWPQR